MVLICVFSLQVGVSQILIEDGKSKGEVRKVKKNGKFELHTSNYFISAEPNSK